MKAPMKKATPPTKKSPAKVPVPGSMPMHDDMKWKAQDALHTLHRAEEIKADKALMGHVKAHAKEQRAHLNKVIRRK